MTPGKKFVLLLRLGMGITSADDTNALPQIADEAEWALVMKLAKKQAVQGILFRGIGQLPPSCRPPRQMLLNAAMRSDKIEQYNRTIDAAAVKLLATLEQAGFPCCILKGQGNALYYPEPASRMPGDIDVWIASPVKRVIDFARQAAPHAKACYHHVEAAPCDGVEVELHYRPAFLNNPLYNHRLQRWFQREAAEQSWHSVALADGTATLNVPTDAFNRIYQMAHIMNHVIHEGVGMRQMMDYYFLLMKGFTAEERQHDERLLRRFGLYDMAGAVMYVLQWLFVLPEDKMLVAPDKRRGVVLLKEILYGGNFGRYHQEAKKARSQWAKNALRSRRDLRLLTVFPSECLCEPLFRLWHFGWRLCHQ